MTPLKLLLLWWLVGAVCQLVMILRLRQKYGRYYADVGTKIILGRFWLLKIFTSCFFWPLGIYAWFFVRPTLTPQNIEHIKNLDKQLYDRCPDCGEPLSVRSFEKHQHEPPS